MAQSIQVRHSLGFRLIFWVSLILLLAIGSWAFFNINYQKKKAVEGMLIQADRLGNTIRLGTQYAMMLNSREDIDRIISNVSRQESIEHIRIYDKKGQIKFSDTNDEVGKATNIKSEACHICHKTDPPLENVSLRERTRIWETDSGYQSLGIISPIYNEAVCASNTCHVHPQNKKVLGLLDVGISLQATGREILSYEKEIIALAVAVVLGISAIIGLFIVRFVNRPIKKLIAGTEHIGRGDYEYKVNIDRQDEIGRLAASINEMGMHIAEKKQELNKQRDEYQRLFEGVPCYITVQNRELKLLRYNREFAEKFGPTKGDFCFKAYKDRTEPCEICPVLQTFEDGESHISEETGGKRGGGKSYWLVRTAPLKDNDGKVVAAMEMCLDVTRIRHLEKEAMKSEEKYRAIFDTIPNPVFVLSEGNLQILDCNESLTRVYGFTKEEVLQTSFLELFAEEERERYFAELRSNTRIEKAKQTKKDGRTIFVNIRISPSEYLGEKVLLVTTSDITQRLSVEQQLIQASKMATLGEMATGVAHELNQPLSVMKTASSFLIKKIDKGEPVEEEILRTLASEIDSHVDRASNIISHMREFGRKADVEKQTVEVNEALRKALQIFQQQLKLREIEVVLALQENLPPVLADPNRLEQVFVNLLINARDAIEDKWASRDRRGESKKIFLKTFLAGEKIRIEVQDTGDGIPAAVKDRIFEPFFTTKKTGKGTGLGLSISYGIVQDYDGYIRVESEEGKGATFVVQFPVARGD